MSLKVLAALVVLVLFGVLSSAHGFMAADHKLHGETAHPRVEAPQIGSAQRCALGACAEAVQPADAVKGLRRQPRRSGFGFRRKLASAVEPVCADSTTPRGS